MISRLALSHTLAALVLLCLLAVGTTPASGAALTTQLGAASRDCYYAWADQVGEKVGVYFAVQSGGDFQISYSIHDPEDHTIIEGHGERQIDIVFTAQKEGEYVVCFSNDHTSYEAKLVDFDITVESEPRLSVPLSEASLLSDHSAPLEDSIAKISSELTAISRNQRFFRTRENRNMWTVGSTQHRIFWYSVFESLVIISMSVAQVLVVRYMFNTGSTKRYRV